MTKYNSLTLEQMARGPTAREIEALRRASTVEVLFIPGRKGQRLVGNTILQGVPLGKVKEPPYWQLVQEASKAPTIDYLRMLKGVFNERGFMAAFRFDYHVTGVRHYGL